MMTGAFLLPFCGPLPPYFAFWAKSCEINQSTFHWFVYSDQYPNKTAINAAVTIIPYNFKEMKHDFKRALAIDIDDTNPRKICNYRLLFYFLRRNHEVLDHFEFIGYTDMDMIYGDLARFVPRSMGRYTMISADAGHPCGPFTLVRMDRLRTVAGIDPIRSEMARKEYRAFDESEEWLNIVAGGGPSWCSPDPLQPAMTARMNHRKVFSVWQRGKVTVYDNHGHKTEGGFHHFSRYKSRRNFHVQADPQQDEKWAVFSKGIVPVRSARDWLRLWASLVV